MNNDEGVDPGTTQVSLEGSGGGKGGSVTLLFFAITEKLAGAALLPRIARYIIFQIQNLKKVGLHACIEFIGRWRGGLGCKKVQKYDDKRR